MGIFYTTYQLNDASLLGVLSMASVIPMIIVLPFVPKLTEKTSIRNASLIGSAIALMGGILIITGGASNIFPLILFGLVLKAIGTAPLTGGLNALIAETDDYSQLRFKRRITGIIYSCSSVGIKVGTGLGTAACGLLLDLGKFNGKALSQLPSAVSTIKWSYLLANALPAVFFIVLFLLLKVEKENQLLRNR